MRDVVAVDAGGTSTRAVVVDELGRCRGVGRAGGGNPTSRGAVGAGGSVVAAVGAALAASAAPDRVALVLLAHAGEHLPAFRAAVTDGLAALDIVAPVVRAGDLTALFASGTHETEGVALIAGTGAIAGAIRRGRLARVIDGTGWLLGDAGSGFWIGHQVVRAVSADLDGGPATTLTPAVLDALGLDDDRTWIDGRPAVQNRLIGALYALRPVELARFAPLAFAEVDDAVARQILRGAADALTVLLSRARDDQPTGPVVFGGSALVSGLLPAGPGLTTPLLAAAGTPPPVPVADGLVGAAVLGLRGIGVEVDATVFARVTDGIRGT